MTSRMRRPLAYLFLTLGVSGAMLAGQERKSIQLPEDNPMAELKPGPGVETARSNCVACHSTDYIVRQPRSDTKKWGAEVQKMITVYGAPIDERDAKVIVDYLASAYGPAAEAPPPAKKPSTGERKKTHR